MNLILLGAPGAGKGTQADFISKRAGIPCISTGNLLREAVKNETELGLKVKSYMESGALVPDEIVIALIKERTALPDCKNGCILDGFPRTIPQAEALDRIMTIDAALSIEVADDVIETRMSGRRVCLKCGATYHLKYNAPQKENTCDQCGDALVLRKDDSPEVVRARLHTYHEQTEPVKGYYEKQGKLKMVVGCERLEDTTRAVAEALGI